MKETTHTLFCLSHTLTFSSSHEQTPIWAYMNVCMCIYISIYVYACINVCMYVALNGSPQHSVTNVWLQ